MKIIGNAENGNYIAIINHEELEKCFDKFYGKLPKLFVGSQLDIGVGHDFRSDIVKACRNMLDAYKSFETSHTSMMNFAVMVQEANQKIDEKP